MSNIVLKGICCSNNCLCNLCCFKVCGISPSLNYRIGYIIICLLTFLVTLLVNYYFYNILLNPFSNFLECPQNDDLQTCLHLSSVYRISFALVIMNILCLFFSICGNGCRKFLQTEVWPIKFLFIFAIFFGLMFVSNKILYYYSVWGKYFSIVFLIYQVLVTISFAHIINLRLVNKLDNSENNCIYKFLLLFLSFLFICFALGFIISALKDYFSWRNLIFCLLNIILGLVFIGVSVSNLVTKKRLLTSIYIFSFTCYLSWSVSISDDNEKTPKVKYFDFGFGMLYLILAVLFVGFFIKKKDTFTSQKLVSSSDDDKNDEENKILENNPIVPEENEGCF